MQPNGPETKFETPDVWLAGALTLLLKTPPEYKKDNSQVVFVFPQSEELYKAIADYNADCSLPVYTYAQVVKRLKAEIIMRRGG